MADFNILDHLRNMRFGQGGDGASAGGDGIANEKETPEIVFEGAKKLPATLAKLTDGIPIIGPLLARLIPTNAGEVGLFASIDSQGIAGKTINPIKGAQGGALYNAIAAPLIKNSAITDQTGGAGGGGGGAFDTGGGGGFAFVDGGGSFADLAGAGSLEWSPVAWASLGGLPRPITPDVGGGVELGMS